MYESNIPDGKRPFTAVYPEAPVINYRDTNWN
jgi:hypothetical protein